MPFLPPIRLLLPGSALLGLGLLQPACDDDIPAREPPSEAVDPPNDIELGLRSLITSVGSVSPALADDVSDYAVAFEARTSVLVRAEPIDDRASVRIAGVEGSERTLVAPLGKTRVEIVVSLDGQSRTYRLDLARTGDLVGEPPVGAPNAPKLDEENPNPKGYLYPAVSPDGRFASVEFRGFDGTKHISWIDVYRIDEPEIVLDHRIETARLNGGFCDRDPTCLWTYTEEFDDHQDDIMYFLRGTGDWSQKSAIWVGPFANTSGELRPASPDAPLEALLYGETETRWVTMRADGTITEGTVVAGLDRRTGSYFPHRMTADRTRLFHAKATADLDPGEVLVFARQGDSWNLEQTLKSPHEGTAYYGSTMLVSDDGQDLYIGDSWATVDGLPEAGVVDHYQQGPTGYTLVATLTEPTPRVGGAFGGFLLGDANTGRVRVGAVDFVPYEKSFTLVYALETLDRVAIEHPGGVLHASRDGNVFVGVAFDAQQHGELRVYR